jgi:hypothetical protein
VLGLYCYVVLISNLHIHFQCKRQHKFQLPDHKHYQHIYLGKRTYTSLRTNLDHTLCYNVLYSERKHYQGNACCKLQYMMTRKGHLGIPKNSYSSNGNIFYFYIRDSKPVCMNSQNIHLHSHINNDQNLCYSFQK